MCVRVNRDESPAACPAAAHAIKPLGRGHFPVVKERCIYAAVQHERGGLLVGYLIDESAVEQEESDEKRDDESQRKTFRNLLALPDNDFSDRLSHDQSARDTKRRQHNR